MKTIIIKTTVIFSILISGFIFSSFTDSKPALVAAHELDEYSKVNEYIWEHIVTPISGNLNSDQGSIKIEYFSRCPSGYDAQIITVMDAVKSDRFVNGKVVFYKGCSPRYVCDFKVCVSRNFAVVKSKGSKEYLSVNEWIKHKNENQKTLVKN